MEEKGEAEALISGPNANCALSGGRLGAARCHDAGCELLTAADAGTSDVRATRCEGRRYVRPELERRGDRRGPREPARRKRSVCATD